MAKGSLFKDTEETAPMPWWSQPFNPEEKRTNLKCRFGVCDMPTLVVIEPKQCRLVEFYGRKDAKDGMDAIEKWRKERNDLHKRKHMMELMINCLENKKLDVKGVDTELTWSSSQLFRKHKQSGNKKPKPS